MEMVLTVVAGLLVILMAGAIVRMLVPKKNRPKPQLPAFSSVPVAADSGPSSAKPTLPTRLTSDLVGRRIRQELQVNPDTAAALAAAMKDLDQTEEIGDIVEILHGLNYTIDQVAKAMAACGYTPMQIAVIVKRQSDLDADDWWSGFYPLFTGEPHERGPAVMALAGEVEEHDWQDDEGEDSYAAEFVPLFVNAGCAPVKIVEHFFSRTGLQDYDILAAWPSASRPPAAEFGRILAANKIEFDPEDIEAYYRQEFYTLAETMTLFRQAGVSAETIVDGLNDVGYDEGPSELLTSLIAAGYDQFEAMAAIESDDALGEVIRTALDAKMPIGGIVDYLVRNRIDADDLDQEMTDQEIDIRDRVSILHAYLFRPPVTVASQAVGESSPPPDETPTTP